MIFNYIQENLKSLDRNMQAYMSISNWITVAVNRHKQVVQEEKIVLVDLNLSRNEFPIDELEFEGKIYPFIKTRLTVNSSDNAFITYLFDG
ncbi:hypothetical protein V7266_10685 [Neobacillus drentensis]|uniref:hypothetical protein n=1 Tax=Neobacillus drentensis TaxID=220684 RepID=UPI002FFDC77A